MLRLFLLYLKNTSLESLYYFWWSLILEVSEIFTGQILNPTPKKGIYNFTTFHFMTLMSIHSDFNGKTGKV